MSEKDPRSVLHSAYSFIRSIESNKAVSALTLDHLLQEHIKSLKGGEVRAVLDGRGESVGNRVSRYDDLEALKQQVITVVQSLITAPSDDEELRALSMTEEITLDEEGSVVE